MHAISVCLYVCMFLYLDGLVCNNTSYVVLVGAEIHRLLHARFFMVD